jgi:hypothetical protein
MDKNTRTQNTEKYHPANLLDMLNNVCDINDDIFIKLLDKW